jgi:hypothetical protein
VTRPTQSKWYRLGSTGGTGDLDGKWIGDVVEHDPLRSCLKPRRPACALARRTAAAWTRAPLGSTAEGTLPTRRAVGLFLGKQPTLPRHNGPIIGISPQFRSHRSRTRRSCSSTACLGRTPCGEELNHGVGHRDPPAPPPPAPRIARRGLSALEWTCRRWGTDRTCV